MVQGAAALTTAATVSSGVGGYPITAGLGTLSAANYTFTFVSARLTVTRAKLTITANNVTWIIGQAEPALTFTISGLANGQSITPLLSTTATSTSPAGKYRIGLKAIDQIKVKRLSPTAQAHVFTVTLVSPDAVLANYKVFYVSAILTRSR